jgi:hypothetical protein
VKGAWDFPTHLSKDTQLFFEGEGMQEITQTHVVDAEKAPAALVYDADAQQRVPFKAERSGKLYKVTHFINAITDDDIMQFERSKQIRLSEADSNETDEADVTAISSTLFAPALELWDKRVDSVENYSFKNAEQWRQELAEGDKAFAINGVVLAVQFVSLPVASGDEACPAEDDDTSTYIMKAVFNGQVVTLRHVLRRAKPDEMTKFQGLMSRVHLVQGTQFGETDQRIPSRAKGLGELYRQVKQEAQGYAGRIPLHHQMLLALRHFRAQHKFDASNS